MILNNCSTLNKSLHLQAFIYKGYSDIIISKIVY